MKKWLFRAAAASFLVGLLGFALVHWLGREPRHAGRPLSAWVADLQNGQPAVREEAAAALRQMGPEALPYLAGELTRGHTPLERAAHAAGKYIPGGLKARLRRLYNPTPEIVRKHAALQAIRAIGEGSTSSVPVVGEILRDSHAGLSSAAAVTLAEMGPAAIPELISALDSGDYVVRAGACMALGLLGTNSAPAIPRLSQIVTNETGAIFRTALATFARIGEPAVRPLTNFLSHTNAEIRWGAAYALKHIGLAGDEALPALLRAAEDEAAIVRVNVLQALASIDATSPAVSDTLVRALDDPAAEVRHAAVTGLAGRQRIVRQNFSQFLELLGDGSPEVRGAAAYALGQTGHYGAKAVPHLEKLLADENEMVVRKASHALEAITNSRPMAVRQAP